jgi:hypothetical protein
MAQHPDTMERDFKAADAFRRSARRDRFDERPAGAASGAGRTAGSSTAPACCAALMAATLLAQEGTLRCGGLGALEAARDRSRELLGAERHERLVLAAQVGGDQALAGVGPPRDAVDARAGQAALGELSVTFGVGVALQR